jgi:hypothetical protein
MEPIIMYFITIASLSAKTDSELTCLWCTGALAKCLVGQSSESLKQLQLEGFALRKLARWAGALLHHGFDAMLYRLMQSLFPCAPFCLRALENMHA